MLANSPNWASVPVLGLLSILGVAFVYLGAHLAVTPRWQESVLQHWDYSAWWGVMMLITCGPATLFCFFFLVSSVYHQHSWSRRVRSDVVGLCALVFVALCILSFVFLLKPGADIGTASDQKDTFGIFIGSILVGALAPLAVVCVWLAARLWSPTTAASRADRQVHADGLKSPLLSSSSQDSPDEQKGGGDDVEMLARNKPASDGDGAEAEAEAEEEAAEGPEMSVLLARHETYTKREHSERVWDNIAVAFLSVVFVPGILLLCMYFPPIWTQQVQAMYALVNGTATPSYMGQYPQKTSDLGYNYALADQTYFKLFPDHIAYFSYAYLIFVMGFLARFPTVNMLFVQTRFTLVPAQCRSLSPSFAMAYLQSIYTTMAELLAVNAFLALAIWWFVYWYTYLDASSPDGRIANLPSFERLARACGQMSSLFLSFLVFPVTRNSVWERVLGIPFDRALKYHRWLGVGFVLSLFFHILFWYSRWIELGTFWHDIFNVNPYIVSPDNPTPHFDNFVLPMLFIVGLMVLVMAVCAYPYIRRRWFEVFYYTHMLSYVVFVAALIHAWALWNYLLGGLLLYYLDRLLRFQKGCTDVTVVGATITKDKEHLRLVLKMPGLRFEPGQYVFLNVRELSPLQWHPFSISGSPLDTHVSFYIKRMGQGSWTDELYQRVWQKSSLTILAEGAYGRLSTLPLPQYQELVLVAGGIGVTPLFALFRHLFYLRQVALHDSSENPLSPSKDKQPAQIVHLHWVVKKPETLTMLSEALNAILRDTHDNAFRMSLYCTQLEQLEGIQAMLGNCAAHFYKGRPNFSAIFTQLRSTLGGRVAVLACGPEPLVDSVSELASMHRFDFHQETFLF